MAISIAVSCSISILFLWGHITSAPGPAAITNIQQFYKWLPLVRLVTCNVNIFCQNYWFVFHPRAFESILKRLHNSSKLFGDSVPFSRVNWFVGLSFIFNQYVSYLGAFRYSHDTVLRTISVHVLPHFYNNVIIVQVVALLEVLHCLFQKLNAEIRVSARLDKMADVHSTLCQVACDVNKMYSFQMFVLINESILYSTATSYTYFNVITAKVIPIECRY